jgi:serine/threonine-protein kinase HipA
VAADVAEWTRTRDDIRWSLAGAQPKLALYRSDDGRWGIPRDSTPTTHILKPAAYGGRHDVNEFLSMRAARYLGLDVADHEVFTTGCGEHVFLARRYDRVTLRGRLARLHQEDFAQALSVDPAHKYQADGGPGVADFARVLAALPAPAQSRARRSLFQALVFSVAAKNTDAHAKNYSVVHLREQMRLAPHYDLGSNVLYQGSQPVESAVTLGGERRVDKIGRAQFEKVARALRIDVGEAADCVEQITSGVADAFVAARHDLLADTDGLQYADRVVDAVSEWARTRGWIA